MLKKYHKSHHLSTNMTANETNERNKESESRTKDPRVMQYFTMFIIQLRWQ